MIHVGDITRWVWIIQESCGEDDCPCESPQVLLEEEVPHATVQRVHMDLVAGGWFASLEEAISYFQYWIKDTMPFTPAVLHCLHDPSVHVEAERIKMRLPYEPLEECGYKGILLIDKREGDAENEAEEDRTFLVFERLKFMNVEALNREHAERLEHIEHFVEAKDIGSGDG